MCVNINDLAVALRSHYKAMLKLDQTRIAVAKCISNLAFGTTLNDQAGIFPLHKDKIVDNDKYSYLDIQLSIRTRREIYYECYEKNIICYAEKWDNVIQNSVIIAI